VAWRRILIAQTLYSFVRFGNFRILDCRITLLSSVIAMMADWRHTRRREDQKANGPWLTPMPQRSAMTAMDG
jgi:hypothetical protein